MAANLGGNIDQFAMTLYTQEAVAAIEDVESLPDAIKAIKDFDREAIRSVYDALVELRKKEKGVQLFKIRKHLLNFRVFDAQYSKETGFSISAIEQYKRKIKEKIAERPEKKQRTEEKKEEVKQSEPVRRVSIQAQPKPIQTLVAKSIEKKIAELGRRIKRAPTVDLKNRILNSGKQQEIRTHIDIAFGEHVISEKEQAILRSKLDGALKTK